MTALPWLGELADQGDDLRLAADVDAGGRLVEHDQHVGSAASHLAMTTFCALPPDSVRTGAVADAVLTRRRLI